MGPKFCEQKYDVHPYFRKVKFILSIWKTVT